MPFLVLDLESFSMCCYLTLVERLLDQWEKQMYLYLSLVEENWRKVAELYHDMERRCYLVWSKWIASITIWRIAGVLAPGENIVGASVGGENDGQYSPLYVNACPFQYIGY